jgi:hypothetical protein
MSIYGKYVVHNDPDEGNNVYILSLKDAIVYVSLIEEKGLDMFNILAEVYNEEELVLYETPLDEVLLDENEALSAYLNKILEEEND